MSADALTHRLLELMRDEDLGDPPRDATAAVLADDGDRRGVFAVRAREALVVAGLPLLRPMLATFGCSAEVEPGVADGQRVEAGTELARITGPLREVVSVERSVLNLLGRLCGVATNTRRYAEKIPRGAPASVYDTRKTTPGLRVLEKYAVRCGGGCCHRFGLHDAVMIKDNHAMFANGPAAFAAFVRSCAERARSLVPAPVFVQVEVDRPEQFEAVLGLGPGGVDAVLLDNMAPSVMASCVAGRDRRAPHLYLEASGGITLESIADAARSGVDRISVGAITRDAATVDIGLDAMA